MSQVSERFGSTGIDNLAAWSPASSSHNRTAGPAAYWRERYRRRLLLTDILIVCAAAALPGILAATQWAGAPELSADRSLDGTALGAVPMAGALAPADGNALRVALVSAAVAIFWLIMLQVFHTRAPRRMAVGAYEYKSIVDSTAAVAGWVAVVALVGNGTGLRSYLLLSLPTGMAALLLGRWCWRHWLHRQRALGHALSDVVVYGQARDTRYVVQQIRKKTGAAYKVVGVVLDGPQDPAAEAAVRNAAPGIPVTHGGAEVESAVQRLGADAVVIAGPLPGGNQAIRDLGWELEQSRTEVILVSSLTNVAGPRIRVRPVEGLPLMHVEQPQFEGGRHVVKRAMDIILSFCALLVLTPAFLVIGFLIRRDSEGGVFFSQLRTGRRGQPFRMHKFRSMVSTAERDRQDLLAMNEGSGPLFKLRNDPRITKVGAWLRKYSLDELPQFYNVLKGDMSLVGPRPPLPEEVATYEGHTNRRLYIKPGVTGLWQINGRSDLDWEESIRLDLYYVENWSVTGDLMIMWRTFKVMINPAGAY